MIISIYVLLTESDTEESGLTWLKWSILTLTLSSEMFFNDHSHHSPKLAKPLKLPKFITASCRQLILVSLNEGRPETLLLSKAQVEYSYIIDKILRTNTYIHIQILQASEQNLDWKRSKPENSNHHFLAWKLLPLVWCEVSRPGLTMPVPSQGVEGLCKC